MIRAGIIVTAYPTWQESNITDFIICLSVEVDSGIINGLMYKTGDSNIGKCQFKHIQNIFKAKLKDKSFNAVHQWHKSLTLNDSTCGY